ncbi:light induced alcohol dehydrogenase Bli-4 [Fusarium beomiforme]|uniref:Light induced alcohol dehydrogenase Bli-4 n=1 Tax=Fusarium beomiforme TaxID=44412 RepID=A0A9P5ANN3_9HYPO|nr:light induced alcohol dehydrogenase Bli-4 [Fusarium beomiforme]
MGNIYSLFFPPSPQFTEENLTAQNGRVFIVTGGYSGVGYELSRMLFQAGGTVYIAGRSQEKAETVIQELKQRYPESSGSLSFLKIALDDLDSIKAAAEEFKSKESRLDVLFNNAGVSNPPAGSVSAQGYELSMATNAIGPWYFTQLLVPILKETAKSQPPASVRVIWTASIVTDLSVPKGGVNMKDVIKPLKDQQANYANSKTGNWYLASVLADQVGCEGVLSVCINPGNLHSNLLRHLPSIIGYVVSPLLYHAKFGAYTNLWAGLSPNLQIEDGGRFILPWGRFHPSPRADLLENLKSKEQGGTGTAAEFAEYCDKVIADHQ